ncbi:MAG: hypothetical protein FK733_08145 [Asgard group archaeon]|nr:hypothetical protein [Asgard group archaeon]
MKKELDEKVKRISDNDTQFSILMVIKTFGSANIKILAEIIGKTESTIFHHISELVKAPKVIEIDSDKTEKTRGKYYRLIPELEDKYQREDDAHQTEIPELLDKILELSDKEIFEWGIKTIKENRDIEDIKESASRSLNYNFLLNNIVLNSFEKAAKEIQSGKIPVRKGIPFPGFSNLSLNFKVSNPRQIIMISKVINDFFARLVELKKQFQEEMDKAKIKEEDRITSYIQLFAGELGEFLFESSR